MHWVFMTFWLQVASQLYEKMQVRILATIGWFVLVFGHRRAFPCILYNKFDNNKYSTGSQEILLDKAPRLSIRIVI